VQHKETRLIRCFYAVYWCDLHLIALNKDERQETAKKSARVDFLYMINLIMLKYYADNIQRTTQKSILNN